MKLCKLHRDKDKDVMFVGELRGKVSSNTDGSTRWTEIRIFKTQLGNWITSIVGRTLHEDEHDRRKVVLCGSDDDALVDALRGESGDLGWLAKKALDEVDVDYTEFVL